MRFFTQGTLICMGKGDAIVKECLRNFGTQLYRVDYSGADKILVWVSAYSDANSIYQNVLNLIGMGNIYEGFL